MNRILKAALVVAGATLAATAFAQQARNLSIVTGGTGGVYYPLGGGLGNMLAKYVPGWQATAEVTGGSVDNLKLMYPGIYREQPVTVASMASKP